MTPEQRVTAMTGKQYMAQVARLSCLPCRLLGIEGTPAQVHHPRKFGGLRSNVDKETIPVCDPHHDGTEQSIHMNRKHVAEMFGMSEQEMAEQTRRDVIALLSCDVRYARAA